MAKIYGLIGRKLGHSYSVPIHNALGNSAYKLYEMEPDEIESFVKNPELGGINVTVPYKLEVMKYLDEISPEAQEIGAVNTVVNRGGKLIGYNTDKDGFLEMLRVSNISLGGKKVMILGGGGASKTAQYCSRLLGAKEIVVIDIADNTPENMAKHADAKIIVNCTPVGMKPNYLKSAVELDGFPKCEGVVDVIYNPLRTKLVMDAQSRNIKAVGGLIMLTAQAKKAHELFFDTKVDDGFSAEFASSLFRQNENIALIGMPGCGKSAVGRLLAKKTGRTLYEADELIVKRAGMSIPEIFATGGEERFREIESQVINDVSQQNGGIIVTGGGVVTKECNYYPLHQNSRIYRITRDIESLATNGRPLSKDLDTLKEMEKIRTPMYERFADVTVENDLTLDALSDKILEDFNENSRY